MMTSSTTTTLMATTTAVIRADSLVPTTRIAVRTMTSRKAIRSKVPPASGPDSATGMSQPRFVCMRWRTYPDQPTATTAVPRANSRTRSQPMIQAGSSPIEAYAKVYADPATGTVEANSA